MQIIFRSEFNRAKREHSIIISIPIIKYESYVLREDIVEK